MRVFVINLDKNVDRLSSVARQLKALNLEFERFPAVNGYVITSDERKRLMSSFHARMARHNPLSKGELGCSLSHTFVLRKMIDENIPVALVLEDDVQLSNKFGRALARVMESIKFDRPQVYLFSNGDFKPFAETDGVPESINRIKQAYFAEAYVVTLPAARNIFRVNYPIVTMNDWWGRWARRGLIELFRVYPLASRQNRETFSTDVTPDGVTIGGGWRFLLWKTCRVFEKIVDELWWILCKK